MRRLLLLRHGETPWNAEGRWQGQTDVELGEAGQLQAKAAAEALRRAAPAFVVSSDLARAALTARYVGEAAGLTPTYDARLREIDVGELAGLTKPEVLERFGVGPYDHGDHGGEPNAAAAARVCAALLTCVDRLSAGTTGIVVSHGTALRLGVGAFLGWPPQIAQTLGALGNCAWVELTETVPSWDVAPGWRLTAYNQQTPIS